ncbi:MAG TPA: hypothetical protein VFF84_03205 [Sphingobium sp.]|nr:hypothetical protein [Sphingobium sp.]
MAEDPKTVIIERRGGGMTALIALLAVIVIAIGAYMYVESNNDKNDAISNAAHKVGDAAKDTADAVKDAVK